MGGSDADFCPGCGLLLGFEATGEPLICPGCLRVLRADSDPTWHGAGGTYLVANPRDSWRVAAMVPEGRVC